MFRSLLLFLGAFAGCTLACDPGFGVEMPEKPPRSCLEYKTLGFPTGKYEIQAAPNTDTLYVFCDMSTYGGGWTLTTRISRNHQQHGTVKGRWNVGDLMVASTKEPTRAAKMSDADINTVAGIGGIRWVIIANYGTFFKYQKQYYSASGAHQCCSCSEPEFYSGYAAPNKNPSWSNGGSHRGSCGGSHTNKGGWSTLSGINYNDNTYYGGYTGSANIRRTPPRDYISTTTGNGQWHQPGYVFERAATSQMKPKCTSCSAGYYNDGKQKLQAKNRWNSIVMKSTGDLGGCIKCPEGTMSYGGARECSRVVSTKQMEAANKLIAENKAAIVGLEKKMKEDVDTVLQGTLQTVQAQLAEVKNQLAAQKTAHDAEMAAVKGDVSTQQTAMDTQIKAVSDQFMGLLESRKTSLGLAFTKGTQNVALPPVKSSGITTCSGNQDPSACDGFSESDCSTPITGASLSAECPVLCNSCKGRKNGPSIATKAGSISFSLHDGDHVRVGNDDFLLTAAEVQQLIQEAFENVKNAM